ncbi:MAG: ATP-dependent DNA helicase RecQ, partial [Bacteroidales bacterium]|nr:ATP-dependent DNA helicase RecQ [Bacteroidales bacterium]
LKVFIIQSIDRKISLNDIAVSKGLSFAELLSEVERIVLSGTKIDIDYYLSETLDPDHYEEIYDYFLEAENDSVEEALKELGENEFTEEEVRLVRIQFISKEGN